MAAVSRSLLVREALARRLSGLGVRVEALSRFDILLRVLEEDAPGLVLIDGDGWERHWDELVRELELRKRGVQGLLLVSSMSVGQALETPALGIGTVILKPFKPEGDWVVLRLPILDLSAGGARVGLPELLRNFDRRTFGSFVPRRPW